jgi:hypothetical protein
MALSLALALAAAPPSRLGVEELITRLGSDDYAVREDATRRLLNDEGAAAALRQALRSPDAEVRRRARQILDAFARREEDRALASLAKLAEEGEVDRAVELFVRRPRWPDEADCWQVMTGLAERLLKRERRLFWDVSVKPGGPAPIGDFHKYVAKGSPQFIVADEANLGLHQLKSRHVVVRAENVWTVDALHSGLFVVSGHIRGVGESLLVNNVIFAGGDVELLGLRGCVVVCGGDCTIRYEPADSLIIARGDVRSAEGAFNCRIITSGKVHIPKKDLRRSTVKEGEANPLGFVKFFDPAREGIAVAPSRYGVRVTAAAPGKPFAAAGLRADDVITALDGSPTRTPAAFRALLRKRVVQGGTASFQIRRDGKASEVRVALP